MVTDEQVRLLMSLISKGMPQVTAAAKAGMSERTARKYVRSGRMPSALKAPRMYRTRPDPFAEVWPEIESLLSQDGGLQAKALSPLAGAIRTGTGSLLPADTPPGRARAVRFYRHASARDPHRRRTLPAPAVPLRADLLELGGGVDLPE